MSGRLQPLLAWIGIVYERDSAQHGEVLRDLCVGMGDLLAMLQRLLDVLVVMPQNMAANLARSQGLVLSEAITFALAGRLGKHSAHEKMKQLARTAQAQGCSLQQAALADPTLAPLLAETPGLFDATSHLGQAVAITDAAVARVRQRQR